MTASSCRTQGSEAQKHCNLSLRTSFIETHSTQPLKASSVERGGGRDLHPMKVLLICDRYSRLSTWRHAWQNPISFLCPHPCVIDLLAVFLVYTLSGAELKIIQVLQWNVENMVIPNPFEWAICPQHSLHKFPSTLQLQLLWKHWFGF